MIIKSKPLKPFFFHCGALFVSFVMRRKFNHIKINAAEIKPGYSYILMCNHFSFFDGILAYYLCSKAIWGDDRMKRLYIMSVKKQMLKNKWLRYIGSFSVEPGKRSMHDTFEYAAEMLSTPGNLLLYYPQGNLESNHINNIHFQTGIAEIVPRIKGDCQLLWCSNIYEYFESIKPSVSFNMLDCGTNHNFDFNNVRQQVNDFHKKALYGQVRFTRESLQSEDLAPVVLHHHQNL